MTSSITNSQFQFVIWLSCHWRDHNKPLWAGCPEQHGGQITKNQEEGDTEKYPDWMAGLVTLTTTHYQELPRGWREVGNNLTIWGLLPWRQRKITIGRVSPILSGVPQLPSYPIQSLQLHDHLVTSPCSPSVSVILPLSLAITKWNTNKWFSVYPWNTHSCTHAGLSRGMLGGNKRWRQISEEDKVKWNSGSLPSSHRRRGQRK